MAVPFLHAAARRPAPARPGRSRRAWPGPGGVAAPRCTARTASGMLRSRPGRMRRVGEHGITELLRHHRDGDPGALDRVFDALYRELRGVAAQRLARLRPGGTLTPTALVHEAWMRLAGAHALELRDRGHFFAVAARAMRHVLLDAARARGTDKRGGGALAVTLTANLAADAPALEMLDIERALVELEAIDPQLSELVELRFFSGMSVEDVAGLRGVSERTVFRQWQQARAFLQVQLGEA